VDLLSPLSPGRVGRFFCGTKPNRQGSRISHFAGVLCALPSPPPVSDGMIPSVSGRYLQRARCNAFSIGEENPQNFPFPWDFVTLCRRRTEPRTGTYAPSTEKLVKIAHVLPEISWRTNSTAYRQTDTYAQICSSQYFAAALPGEVEISRSKNRKKTRSSAVSSNDRRPCRHVPCLPRCVLMAGN